jgi:hypothetical protein
MDWSVLHGLCGDRVHAAMDAVGSPPALTLSANLLLRLPVELTLEAPAETSILRIAQLVLRRFSDG